MNFNRSTYMGILFMAIIVMIVVFVSDVDDSEKYAPGSGMETVSELNYTESELQTLYDRYNISENDIKFAKGKLPNYLNGTILDSNKRVITTENGTPPEGLVKGEDYDVVISHEEMSNITDRARQEYIEKYGVDPANPKVDMVNGQPLPKEAIKKIIKGEQLVVTIDTNERTSNNSLTLNHLIQYLQNQSK